MKTIVYRIFIVFVIALVVAYIFRIEVGSWLFERSVADSLGVDPTADFADGIHVYVCGAGSPLPDPIRNGPCIGILAGEDAFVFDAGSGGSRNLMRMRFPYDRIQRIFITHYHSDHIDGLGALLMQTWINGTRKTPIQVLGPVGISEVVEGFNQAYSLDSQYRNAHHGSEIADIAGSGAIPVEFEFERGVELVFESEELRISAFHVDHQPVMPAVGYRIDYRGRSVVISGDTNENWEAAEAARGVDLLLHEALNKDMVASMAEVAAARERVTIAKVLRDIPHYHTSPVDAAKLAKESGAQELLLYHIIPPLSISLLDAVFLKGVDEHFEGRVTVAADGDLVSLPVGSTEINHSSLF